VGLSATTATTRRPLGAVLENPRSKDFLLEVMREVVRVGRAKGRARLQGGSGVGAGFHTAVVDGQPQGKLPRPEREEEGAGHG